MRFLALVVALVLAWYGVRTLGRLVNERGAEFLRAGVYLRPRPMTWQQRGRNLGGQLLLVLAWCCLGVSVGLGPWWGVW